mmetsp:Transcript_83112/g.258531  ORF Transcript_83112/g.258531 Transcript_83112/m.258531 type:complete len:334 (-) Transcript_83112:263-1264(-)
MRKAPLSGHAEHLEGRLVCEREEEVRVHAAASGDVRHPEIQALLWHGHALAAPPHISALQGKQGGIGDCLMGCRGAARGLVQQQDLHLGHELVDSVDAASVGEGHPVLLLRAAVEVRLQRQEVPGPDGRGDPRAGQPRQRHQRLPEGPHALHALIRQACGLLARCPLAVGHEGAELPAHQQQPWVLHPLPKDLEEGRPRPEPQRLVQRQQLGPRSGRRSRGGVGKLHRGDDGVCHVRVVLLEDRAGPARLRPVRIGPALPRPLAERPIRQPRHQHHATPVSRGCERRVVRAEALASRGGGAVAPRDALLPLMALTQAVGHGVEAGYAEALRLQ